MRSKFLLFSIILILESCIPRLQYYSFDQGDSNKNGVRDDIEKYIKNHYRDQNLINAAMQYSYYSWILTTPNLVKKEFIENYKKKQVASNCFWFMTTAYGLNYDDEIAQLFSRHINSIENLKKNDYFLQQGARFQAPFVQTSYSKLVKNPENYCFFEIVERERIINIVVNKYPGLAK